MCNLYSLTKNQDAIRRLFDVTHDLTGNLPPLPGIFADCATPIMRDAGSARELVIMRWGIPPVTVPVLASASPFDAKMASPPLPPMQPT